MPFLCKNYLLAYTVGNITMHKLLAACLFFVVFLSACVEQATKPNTEQEKINTDNLGFATEETELGTRIILGEISFETNKAALTAKAKKEIKKIIPLLQQYSKRSILINGHTDNVGSAEYNMKLSKRRAESVHAELLNYQLTNKFHTSGYGENIPIASNDSEIGRHKNRRVEILILPEGFF